MSEPEVGGVAGERGALLFSSRMWKSDPVIRTLMAVISFLPVLLVLFPITGLLHGDFLWYVHGFVVVVLIFGIIILGLFISPPFRVYEKGFVTVPDGIRRALLYRTRFVPFERTLNVHWMARGDSATSKEVRISYQDEEGLRQDLWPLSLGPYLGDDCLVLFHVLNQRVPDKVNGSVGEMLSPDPVGEALGEDEQIPEGYIDAGAILLKNIMIPVLVFVMYALGSEFYFALHFYHEGDKGLLSFEITLVMLIATAFTALGLRYGTLNSIRMHLATNARLVGDVIQVAIGRVDRWFYRVVDPLPLSSISTVSVRMDVTGSQRYLVTTFSTGEEYILPLEITKKILADPEPGENPFVMRYTKGGEELEGPVVRVNRWGVFMFSMIFLLIVIVSFLYEDWSMDRLLG